MILVTFLLYLIFKFRVLLHVFPYTLEKCMPKFKQANTLTVRHQFAFNKITPTWVFKQITPPLTRKGIITCRRDFTDIIVYVASAPGGHRPL